jgi:hypothetical protein
VIGGRLLDYLCRSCVARDIRVRTIATVEVTLVYHFGQLVCSPAPLTFGSVAAADAVWA